LRLRLLSKGDAGPARPEMHEALEAAMDLLGETRSGSGRRALLAWVLALGDAGAADGGPLRLDVARVVGVARAREDAGERPLVPTHVVTPVEVLAEPVELRPMATPDVYARSAERLEELARGATVAVADARVLRDAAAGLRLEAGRELALAGDADAASAAFDAGLALAGAGSVARALARSTARWLAGDVERAFSELEPIDLATTGSDAAGRAARAAALVQRAELLAALGRRADATATADAAERAGSESGDRAIELRARWARLALGTAPAPREGAARFRWLGFGDAAAPWLRGSLTEAADDTLASWARARAAGPSDRVAERYDVLRLRGDAPPWHGLNLALAGSIAPAKGDVETWLDAFYAVDRRRISFLAHAWWRGAAARMRGDAAAAKRWDETVRSLRAISTDASRRELARYVGF
jgi:hypothetical protein